MPITGTRRRKFTATGKKPLYKEKKNQYNSILLVAMLHTTLKSLNYKEKSREKNTLRIFRPRADCC